MLNFRRLLFQILNLEFVHPTFRLPIFIALGVFAGAGLVVANISRAVSYMSDAPETCVNCHVMFPQYLTWQHSSHANVAHCNDCHVPHTSFVSHYSFKARDGLRHSTIFTLRLEPEVIRISHAAVPVVQLNCRRCHAEVIAELPMMDAGGKQCWDCHRDIPHGTARSLSVTPNTFAPQLSGVSFLDVPHLTGGRPPRTSREVDHE